MICELIVRIWIEGICFFEVDKDEKWFVISFIKKRALTSFRFRSSRFYGHDKIRELF